MPFTDKLGEVTLEHSLFAKHRDSFKSRLSSDQLSFLINKGGLFKALNLISRSPLKTYDEDINTDKHPWRLNVETACSEIVQDMTHALRVKTVFTLKDFKNFSKGTAVVRNLHDALKNRFKNSGKSDVMDKWEDIFYYCTTVAAKFNMLGYLLCEWVLGTYIGKFSNTGQTPCHIAVMMNDTSLCVALGYETGWSNYDNTERQPVDIACEMIINCVYNKSSECYHIHTNCGSVCISRAALYIVVCCLTHFHNTLLQIHMEYCIKILSALYISVVADHPQFAATLLSIRDYLSTDTTLTGIEPLLLSLVHAVFDGNAVIRTQTLMTIKDMLFDPFTMHNLQTNHVIYDSMITDEKMRYGVLSEAGCIFAETRILSPIYFTPMCMYLFFAFANKSDNQILKACIKCSKA